MKSAAIVVLMAVMGLAHATDFRQPHDVDDHEHSPQAAEDNASAPTKLSRQKRGVVPVVGMPCPSGYKQVGDDCAPANIEFE